MTRKVTVGLILSTIAIWIGWDIYAFVEPTSGDTESEVLRDWGWRSPAFVWALGALLGHWFGNFDALSKLRSKMPWSPLVLATIGIGLGAANLGGVLPGVHPLLALAAGVPFGMILWGQSPAADTEDRTQ